MKKGGKVEKKTSPVFKYRKSPVSTKKKKKKKKKSRKGKNIPPKHRENSQKWKIPVFTKRQKKEKKFLPNTEKVPRNGRPRYLRKDKKKNEKGGKKRGGGEWRKVLQNTRKNPTKEETERK